MKFVDLSPYKVLLVDDVAFSRQVIFKMLTDLDAQEVHQAETGKEAMDILRVTPDVDFVISDFKMPNFNGLQLLKAIRTGQTNARRETPFVMLTGYSERHLVDMALALDVNAFLGKPVSKQTFSTRLDKMLSRDSGEMKVKPVEAYESIVIEETEEEPPPETVAPPARKKVLKNIEVTRKVVGGMSSLSGKFKQSDLAKNITTGVDKLVTDAGGEAATKVVSFIDDLVKRGILELEDVPDVLDTRDEGLWSSNAPVKRKKISGVWASAGKGEEDFYPLNKIPLGAVLSKDILSKDGSQLIKKDIPLTQQVISILAHLRKVDAVTLATMEIEEPPETQNKSGPVSEPPGVFANFSPTPENDGQTKAFDSEGPPTQRFTQAMRGDTGWEKSVQADGIPEGATLTRDIYTTDGRLYMYAGAELTGKVISILGDLQELGNLQTNIWIATK